MAINKQINKNQARRTAFHAGFSNAYEVNAVFMVFFLSKLGSLVLQSY